MCLVLNNNDVEVVKENNTIVVYLPITKPTSKVRVKRNYQPIPTRQIPLRESDEIEWQISYFGENNECIELCKIICFAKELGFIKSNVLRGLKNLIETISDDATFERKYSSNVEFLQRTHEKYDYFDYLVGYRRFPVIYKTIDKTRIEIELKHKQRAVGFQSMVYIYIPLSLVASKTCGKVVNRPAEANEKVKWVIHESNKVIIEELVKAFAIASPTHRKDMIDLLTNLDRYCSK